MSGLRVDLYNSGAKKERRKERKKDKKEGRKEGRKEERKTRRHGVSDLFDAREKSKELTGPAALSWQVARCTHCLYC
eukprot:1159211-Pelagomonas_calceolata.AAC.6